MDFGREPAVRAADGLVATPFAPMLSVPVFIVMVGLTRLLAGGLASIGLASLRPLLLL